MQIVHVVRQFHPGVGGIEEVVLELATAQVAAGYRVRVVTLNRLFKDSCLRRLPERDAINGIDIARIGFTGSSRYPLAPSVVRFIQDADVVHVHAIDFFFDFLAWTKPWHRKRMVVSTHGGFFHTQYAALFKRLYFATATRLSLAWYDAVVAVSTSDYELFGRLRRQGIVCIDNGVNVAKYADAAALYPAKTIIWVGRFSANKRLDRLVSFFAALNRQDQSWRLKIAGRAWDLDEAQVAALVQHAGIADKTELLVSPSDSEIHSAFGSCSVLVSSSDFEGFGIAPIEGLSAGLFPVLSDIAPFRRLVQQADLGMVVDFGRPEAAAAAFLGRWGEISRDYRRVRRTAIAAASKFDWGKAACAYADLYDAVLGSRMRRILGVSVPVLTRLEAVEQLDRNFEKKIDTLVAFANANCLNMAFTDTQVLVALEKAVVLNDGIGVDLASRLLFGAAFPDNLNGTDFTPFYLQKTRHQFRVFLLGAKPGVAERAARLLTEVYPRHKVVGQRDGFFSRSDDSLVAKAIGQTGADLVLVALGNPEQEIWLKNNLSTTGCRLGFAVGALLDFMAGDARRAPVWIRAARLEWIYRLAMEPSRLWRRYLLGNPIFLMRVLGQWWSGARV